MFNQVVLIGRMAIGPKLTKTQSNLSVVNFRIAVDRSFTNTAGERETDFIDIVAWRETADFISNYVTTGRLVLVEGRLQVRQWKTDDGVAARAVEIVADVVRTLDRPKQEN